MTHIANGKFNDSLDDYISRRKDKRFSKMHTNKHSKSSIFDDGESSKSDRQPFSFFSFFRKRIPDESEIAQKENERNKQKQMAELQDDGDIPPEVIAKQVEKAALVKPKVEVVDDDDDFEDDIAEQKIAPAEKKEGGFMNKLFGFGNKKQEQERDEALMQMQLQEQNIEDLKETIKILHKWLEKLPSDKIYEFKRSPDFEKYKEGLRKLGLIKE